MTTQPIPVSPDASDANSDGHEALRGYVAGSGPVARRLRRILRELGWRATSGRSVEPSGMSSGQTIDVFFTTEIATAAAHQHALSWAALDGVAVIGLAERGQPERLQFFDAGADDVWDPDLPPEEARCRLAALMRRVGRKRLITLQAGERSVVVTRTSALVDGRPFTTTPIRHRLLFVLAERAPETVENEALARLVWGHRHVEDAGFVHTQVSRLRRELARAGVEDVITTSWGIGYAIHAESRY